MIYFIMVFISIFYDLDAKPPGTSSGRTGQPRGLSSTANRNWINLKTFDVLFQYQIKLFWLNFYEFCDDFDKICDFLAETKFSMNFLNLSKKIKICEFVKMQKWNKSICFCANFEFFVNNFGYFLIQKLNFAVICKK